MSDIPSFPYRLLWGERSVVSVANLTRADGRDFMRLAATLQLEPSIEIARADGGERGARAAQNGEARRGGRARARARPLAQRRSSHKINDSTTETSRHVASGK